MVFWAVSCLTVWTETVVAGRGQLKESCERLSGSPLPLLGALSPLLPELLSEVIVVFWAFEVSPSADMRSIGSMIPQIRTACFEAVRS